MVEVKMVNPAANLAILDSLAMVGLANLSPRGLLGTFTSHQEFNCLLSS
jgi:hypothetical protein